MHTLKRHGSLIDFNAINNSIAEECVKTLVKNKKIIATNELLSNCGFNS